METRCIGQQVCRTKIRCSVLLKSVLSAAMFTQTTIGTYRIYSTLLDEPDFFVLSASIGHPYRKAQPVASFWLEASHVEGTLAISANPSVDQHDSPDRVVILFADGALGVMEVSVCYFVCLIDVNSYVISISHEALLHV